MPCHCRRSSASMWMGDAGEDFRYSRYPITDTCSLAAIRYGTPQLPASAIAKYFTPMAHKVSFTLPIPKDPIIPCDGGVRSNSLLLITTSQGVETVGLCVQP